MSESTPGPWATFGLDPNAALVKEDSELVYTADGTKIIAQTFGSEFRKGFHSDRVSPKEAEANARLIAAAPQLLNAHPTVPHPGGRLVKVVAHYEDGTTQTVDGAIVESAVYAARGKTSE